MLCEFVIFPQALTKLRSTYSF